MNDSAGEGIGPGPAYVKAREDVMRAKFKLLTETLKDVLLLWKKGVYVNRPLFCVRGGAVKYKINRFDRLSYAGGEPILLHRSLGDGLISIIL